MDVDRVDADEMVRSNGREGEVGKGKVDAELL